jgi:hypothetical protein
VYLLVPLLMIEREQALRTGREGMSEGTAQSGLTDIETQAEDDGVPEDEVHRALCIETGKAVEEAADEIHDFSFRSDSAVLRKTLERVDDTREIVG